MPLNDLTRRNILGGLAAGAGLAAAPIRAAETVKTKLTATQALNLLKRGNANYLTDSPVRAAQGRMRRLAIARSQAPIAVLVSCSDSRVPPELLFGRGLGELFIVRNAGNTVDTTALGSIEYAVAALGVPLVIVMGHERCGAVEAAVNVVQRKAEYPGSIGSMLEPILVPVLKAQTMSGDLLDNAVRENVRSVVKRLREASEPLLFDALKKGARIVGARYDLDDGKVDFFDEGLSGT